MRINKMLIKFQVNEKKWAVIPGNGDVKLEKLQKQIKGKQKKNNNKYMSVSVYFYLYLYLSPLS